MTEKYRRSTDAMTRTDRMKGTRKHGERGTKREIETDAEKKKGAGTNGPRQTDQETTGKRRKADR